MEFSKNGNVLSNIVKNVDDNDIEKNKFYYDSKGFLIKQTKTLTTKENVQISSEKNYENNSNGNQLKSTSIFLSNINEKRIWQNEFQYDEKEIGYMRLPLKQMKQERKVLFLFTNAQ